MFKPALAGATAAALLLGALAPAGATVRYMPRAAVAGSAATAAWVSTATAGMPVVKGVTITGAMPAATQLRITVGLQQNTRAAREYLSHITTPGDALYGQYLSPAEYTQAFGISAAAAQNVAKYLQSVGLASITVAPNRQLITASGSVATIERAFNTRLGLYSANGKAFFANTTAAQVPAALGRSVAAITGINSFSTYHTNIDRKTEFTLPGSPNRVAAGFNAANSGPGDSSTCTDIPPSGLYLNPGFFTGLGLPVPPVTGVTFPQLPVGLPISPDACLLATLGPKGYQRLYDASTTTTGSITNIAIIAEGKLAPQVLPKDLVQFETSNHVPAVSYSIIPTAAASTLTDTSGQDEFDLDTQYSSGMASRVKHMYVYDGPSLQDADLENETNQFVVDDLAKSASESIGGCEFLSATDGDSEVTDNILLEADVQGQSLFVSSGDEGSACALVANTGYPVGAQSVEYPSSSPYVVAVGGTSVIPTSTVNYQYEVSWIGGGGGVSYFEPAPVWQFNNGVVSAELDHRGVPDVAMPADPNFGGAAVVVAGAVTGVGGTSLAAPLSNGVFARLMSAHNNALGLAAPAFYKVYSKYNGSTTLPSKTGTSFIEGGFHDIFLGSNGLYQATPGYDYTTGLGSFDVSRMQSVIGK